MLSMYYEIYILQKSGTCLFHQRLYNLKERQVMTQLVTGFFSAMFAFTSEFVDKKLEIMEIEYLRLVFEEFNDYIFVAFVDEYESLIQVKEILKTIAETFFDIYLGVLKTWNSNLEIFKGFDKEIERILIKNDIDRMFLIEKLSELLEFEEEPEVEGLFVYTTKAELMLSTTPDDEITQFISKLIETNQHLGFNFDTITITRNNQQLMIKKISEFLIAAILLKPNLSFNTVTAISEYLFKKFRTSINSIITTPL